MTRDEILERLKKARSAARYAAWAAVEAAAARSAAWAAAEYATRDVARYSAEAAKRANKRSNA